MRNILILILQTVSSRVVESPLRTLSPDSTDKKQSGLGTFEPTAEFFTELMRSERDSIGQNRLGNNIFLRHNSSRNRQSIIDQILKTLKNRLTDKQARNIKQMIIKMKIKKWIVYNWPLYKYVFLPLYVFLYSLWCLIPAVLPEFFIINKLKSIKKALSHCVSLKLEFGRILTYMIKLHPKSFVKMFSSPDSR